MHRGPGTHDAVGRRRAIHGLSAAGRPSGEMVQTAGLRPSVETTCGCRAGDTGAAGRSWRQAEAILGPQLGEFRQSTEDASQPVPREASLTFVPVAEGVEFDPTASGRCAGLKRSGPNSTCVPARRLDGQYARGRISVLLGDILLARHQPLHRSQQPLSTPATEAPPATSSARPYRKIFRFVLAQGHGNCRAVRASRDSIRGPILRDWTDLRSGEVWVDGLRQLIDRGRRIPAFLVAQFHAFVNLCVPEYELCPVPESSQLRATVLLGRTVS